MAAEEGSGDLAGDGTEFAHHLMRAALTAPGSGSSPGASRTIAGVVGLLASEGMEHGAGFYLGALPGEPSSFEVSAYRDAGSGGWRLDRAVAGLDVGEALREASRMAQSGARRVAVVAVAGGGLRRKALEGGPGGAFEFVFPSADAFEGDPDRCREAAGRWAAGLGVAEPEPRPAEPPAPIPVAPEPQRATPPGADMVDVVREALADVTVEVDLALIEEVVGRAVSAGVATNCRGVPTADEVAREVTAALIPAIPAPEPPDVDDVARRVADRLAPVLAARVVNAMGGDVPGGYVAQATVMSAADQLHVQLEAFNDRIGAGSRSLEALADELASRERTAADLTEQLARTVQDSLERLSRHVDRRLDQIEKGLKSRRKATDPSLEGSIE